MSNDFKNAIAAGNFCMTRNKSLSPASRASSFVHAGRGLKAMIQSEPNAKIHVVAAVAVGVLAWTFKASSAEWCFLILGMMAVGITEALNTAIECLTDLVSPEFHPLAGKVKDISAGAVLIAAIGAAVVGAVIFVPKVI
jgi:diacylglycerol kinase